ncbi:MAG: ribosome biogenesis GTP-binding protein YsxC, partial [Mailhella sp.]|nr:ribosome biogenesis GTP-binding protein YsxC [Mailhella sp.]
MPDINTEKKNVPAPTLELLATLYTLDQLKSYVHDRPQIALAGRSNVGKSSLINNLTRNSKLARTSSEPGKTRLVNLYCMNDAFFLVDLPGYGFARAPKQEKEKWAAMIEGYLENSENLR